MKKHRKARQFLDELRRTPIVSAVCKQMDISRQTIYRWLKEEQDFKKEYEECMSQGIDNVNDLAISQTINKIQQGNDAMIKFWLINNHERFSRKRESPIDEKAGNPKTLAEILRESLRNKEKLDQEKAKTT